MNPLDFMRGLGAGDWPTWLSFFSSTGALIAATAAAVYTGRTVTIERRRDDRLEQAAIRRQANLITAYPVTVHHRPEVGGLEEVTTHAADADPGILILNRSDLPIYNAQVTYPTNQRPGLIPPDNQRLVHVVRRAIGEDHPSPLSNDADLDHATLSGLLATLTDRSNPPDDRTRSALLKTWMSQGRCAITFTDATGRRWRRNIDGTLDLIDDLPTHTDAPRKRSPLTKRATR